MPAIPGTNPTGNRPTVRGGGPWKLVGEISNHHGNFGKAADEASAAKFELYHLKDDPAEKSNLADRQPEIYSDLKRRHLEWLRAFVK